jgi:hypothetical protein
MYWNTWDQNIKLQIMSCLPSIYTMKLYCIPKNAALIQNSGNMSWF